jgi:SAM-dependent methyltransferase
MKISLVAREWFALPDAGEHTARLVATGEVRRAVDIGCGSSSHLRPFRPPLVTVGVDAFAEAVEASRAAGVHDHYRVIDLLKEDVENVLEPFGGEKCDLVTLYGVIEHFPKSEGLALLERCERLTSKYILAETPNGFVEQGPEFGNEHQRHLSGWFVHDFEGLGYSVYGTTGTKYLRGYNADLKFAIRGTMTLDVLLSAALGVQKHPQHAFNLLAVKDVRGVPARLTNRH